MLAAEAFKLHEINAAAALLDHQAWDTYHQEHAPPVLAQRQAMKLLDLDNVRSLLLRSVCRKGPPSRNNHRNAPHVPDTDPDLDHADAAATAAAAMDPSGVNRLLALDIEELVRHTSRLQRKRHAASHVRKEGA